MNEILRMYRILAKKRKNNQRSEKYAEMMEKDIKSFKEFITGNNNIAEYQKLGLLLYIDEYYMKAKQEGCVESNEKFCKSGLSGRTARIMIEKLSKLYEKEG